MEILPPWARALGVTLDQIQSWLREGASKSQLLEWCLDHSKFKEQDYLKWAREYYSLPVVKVDFFEKPVPEELWAKTKSNSWKESFFPLMEWDGVLFIGCLEPPATATANNSIQFLLAPRSLQKIWWQALNGTKNQTPAFEIPSAPTAQTKSMPTTASALPSLNTPSANDDGAFELAFEIEDVLTEKSVIVPLPAAPVVAVAAAPIPTPPPAPALSIPPIATAAPTQVAPIPVPPPAPVLNIPEIIPEPEIEDVADPVLQPVPESVGGLHLEMTEPAPLDKEIGLHLPPSPEKPVIPEKESSLNELTGALEGLTYKAEFTSLTEPGSHTIPTYEEEHSVVKEELSFEMPAGLSLSANESSSVKSQDTSSPAITLSLGENVKASSEAPAALSLSLATTEKPVEITGVTQLSPAMPPPAPVTSPRAPAAPVVAAPPPAPTPVATPPPLSLAIATPPAAPVLAMTPPTPSVMPSAPVVAPTPTALPPSAPKLMPPPAPTGLAPLTPPPVTAAPTPPPIAMPTPVAAVPPPMTMPPPMVTPPPMMTPPPMTMPPPMQMPTAASVGWPPAIQEVFQRMKEHYEQCMVLTFTDERLVPSYWDSTWTLAMNAPPAIDHQPASVFRIVIDSKGPYHGYVAPNPVNDAFFQAWNKAKYPEHLTVVPIIVQNEVTGMILGTTSRVRGTMVPLGFYQSLANELGSKLKTKVAA